MKTLAFCLLLFVSVQQKVNYQVVSTQKNNLGLTNRLYVYIDNAANIKAVNKLLVDKYKKPGVSSFQVYYFDDINTAKIYKDAIFDVNISNAKAAEISRHVIGKFTADGETQLLHLGKGSDSY
jgi:hypothetical protein